MIKILGKQSIQFENPPSIVCGASIVGPKEGKGPLKKYFDVVLQDVLWGEDTWEKAESKLINEGIALALQKANLNINQIRYIFSGDLLNQLTASSFAMREYDIPFFGLYGACSTMGESLQLAAMTIDGGFADYVIASTSSHFCGAEKQFRYPLEFGSQRPLSSTWTVTGSGTVILAREGLGPYITHITTGIVVDYGIKDAMNMGAAMAPAAANTIVAHLKDTGRTVNDYDLFVTGDLGAVGKKMLLELLEKEGYIIKDKHMDCGIEIFDSQTQDTHAGGSGCGCAASTLSGYLLTEIENGTYKRILFLPTGAMMSTVSTQQGESIPSICYGVVIEKR